MRLLEGLVLNGSLSSLWPALFGLLAFLDFGPYFFFSGLLWALSFYKVWQGFIILVYE